MSAAIQQQEYLERLRAAQLAERDERIRKKAQAKAFQSLLDPDGHSGGGGASQGGSEEDEEPSEDSEQGESGGFGKHYA